MINKTKLNLIYNIKDVGGGSYNTGFYEALQLADNTIRLVINKRIIQAKELGDKTAEAYLIGLRDVDLQ